MARNVSATLAVLINSAAIHSIATSLSQLPPSDPDVLRQHVEMSLRA